MRNLAILLLVAMLATELDAQNSCPNGRTVPDYGFDAIDCKDCMRVVPTNGTTYVTFPTEPVLRSIRRGGPAAGKLNEGDTLVSIDGLSIKKAEGARRLVEWGPTTSQFIVRRGNSTRTISITPVGVCPPATPLVTSNRMGRSELLQSSAIALTQLQQSNAEEVRNAVERARLARSQFERDAATRDGLVDALRRAAIADSLAVARATDQYGARAINRRQFENDVGLLRADAIIRARLDSARVRGARDEQMLESQWILQRELRWKLDSASARAAQVLSERRRVDSTARDFRRDTAAVRAQGRSALATEAALRQNLRLPTASLGMGLICAGACDVQIVDRRNVWNFTTYPVVGAVEPGALADRLGLRRGDTLKTIDDISVTTRAGGERLSAIAPGRTIKLGWSRDGVPHTASMTLAQQAEGATPGRTNARMSQTVGTTTVEVFGGGASWTRDPQTGALRITGDSITVIVRPTTGERDTVRRIPPQ